MRNALRGTAKHGYLRIFWGLFLVSFHVYYGTAAILPPVMGYLLIFSGLVCMKDTGGRLCWNRAKKACIGMLLLSFVCLFLPAVYEKVPILTVFALLWTALYSIVYILLIYHLLEGSVQRLRDIGREEAAVKTTKRLYSYLLLFLLLALGRLCAEISLYDMGNTIVKIAFMVLQAWLLTVIFRIIRAVRKKTADKADEGNSELFILHNKLPH